MMERIVLDKLEARRMVFVDSWSCGLVSYLENDEEEEDEEKTHTIPLPLPPSFPFPFPQTPPTTAKTPFKTTIPTEVPTKVCSPRISKCEFQIGRKYTLEVCEV